MSYFLLFLLLLALLAPLGLLAWRQFNPSPTGSYLSPLPQGDQAAVPTPQTLAFYLTSAQTALAKARQLANSNSAQTLQDKQQIITLLNQALAATNQAISFYPQNPQAYQERATILFSVAHLNSSVKPLAEQDLKIAQGLSASTDSLPEIPPANPLDTLPLEQARLAQNLVIASPADPTSGVGMPFTPEVKSNVTKGTTVLPAGETELEIRNLSLEIDSTIYLIPQGNTQNHPVYVQSKTQGSFVLNIDKPVSIDLTIDYWIINQ